MKISDIKTLEILDSRGNPTVSATVYLDDGSLGTAFVPSGASTGEHEAKELRDNDPQRFGGKGVLKALDNINTKIKPAILGMDPSDQFKLDQSMIDLDGTDDKSNLGANAILAVSMASARAAANSLNQPLYKYLSRLDPDFSGNFVLPRPMFNVLNGGRHANWATDIQEYLLMPVGANNFAQALRMAAEIYHHLKKILQDKNYATTVGDEGGFAPAVKNNEETFDLLMAAVKAAGYQTGQDIIFGIDAAASEFYDNALYHLKKEGKSFNSQELMSFYNNLRQKYPIYSWEDTMAEDDWEGFVLFQKNYQKMQVIGDDLYVTNSKRLQKGIDLQASNSILIKLNQIGTLTETINTIKLAHKNNFTTVLSHRSGETEDSFIADFSVAFNLGQIKSGSVARSERLAKYNRLLAIESELGDQAQFASWPFNI